MPLRETRTVVLLNGNLESDKSHVEIICENPSCTSTLAFNADKTPPEAWGIEYFVNYDNVRYTFCSNKCHNEFRTTYTPPVRPAETE